MERARVCSGRARWARETPASSCGSRGCPRRASRPSRGSSSAGCGRRAAPRCVLDGDDVRGALVPPPGYAPGARDAFYATLARLAALAAAQGLVVVVPATAHRAAYRDEAKRLAPAFIEVHVDVGPDECRRRDAKGLYAAAGAGRAAGLPGADLAYEPPAAPRRGRLGRRDDEARGGSRPRAARPRSAPGPGPADKLLPPCPPPPTPPSVPDAVEARPRAHRGRPRRARPPGLDRGRPRGDRAQAHRLRRARARALPRRRRGEALRPAHHGAELVRPRPPLRPRRARAPRRRHLRRDPRATPACSTWAPSTRGASSSRSPATASSTCSPSTPRAPSTRAICATSSLRRRGDRARRRPRPRARRLPRRPAPRARAPARPSSTTARCAIWSAAARASSASPTATRPAAPSPFERLAALERRAVDFRWKLRGRAHRLRRTHGDFHPYNILFREGADFTLLDASRGGARRPGRRPRRAHHQLRPRRRRVPRRLAARARARVGRVLVDATSTRPATARCSRCIPPFLAWRALVVASPVWYPSLTPAMRDALLGVRRGGARRRRARSGGALLRPARSRPLILERALPGPGAALRRSLPEVRSCGWPRSRRASARARRSTAP